MAPLRPECAAFDEDLSALLDGELAPPREQELRGHLAGCAQCSARAAALREVDDALRALPAPPLPAGLEARLRARLHEERREAATSAGPPQRGSPRRRRRWVAWSAIGSAAAASLALYLVSGRDASPPREARAPGEAPSAELARREAPAVPAPRGTAERAGGETRLGVQAGTPPAAAAAEPAPELGGVPEEELALALELDTLADLELLESLELVERLAALTPPGSG